MNSVLSLQKRNQSAIIGYNRPGINIYKKLTRERRTSTKVLGFINVYPLDEEDKELGYNNLLGEIDELDSIAQKYKIDKVIIALDPRDIKKLHEVIERCKKARIEYEIISDSYDVVYGRVFEQVLKDISRPIEISWRHLFDLLIAVPLFIIFLPLWIIVSIAIKLDSKGAVIYSQERVGKNNRIFRIFKFRSMYSDAEKMSGPQLATENDPRITRMGRFMRKTRIDEIPQLINVIIGDMSIIGPRPERPYFTEKYRKQIPFYINRLQVKPGITGLAQVETGYDESIEDVQQKLKYDLHYIKHRSSLWLNLKVLFKTLAVVIGAKGM